MESSSRPYSVRHSQRPTPLRTCGCSRCARSSTSRRRRSRRCRRIPRGAECAGGRCRPAGVDAPACEPISHELIKEALRYVLDKAHHPLLVVSASGTHQVGALVGCLRRMQGWTLSSTLEEYRHFAAPSARLATEHFIELWDCDLLTLPSRKRLPRWFVLRQQQERQEEEAHRKGQLGTRVDGRLTDAADWTSRAIRLE